jgi:hypothetical protein
VRSHISESTRSMGLKYFHLWEESESSKQGRRREICMEKGTIFTIVFWTGREELSARKNTSHVVLEGNHCLVVYAKKEACLCVASL